MEVEPALGEYLALNVAASIDFEPVRRARLLARSTSLADMHGLLGHLPTQGRARICPHLRYGFTVGLTVCVSAEEIRGLSIPDAPVACALYWLRVSRTRGSERAWTALWSRRWPTLRNLFIANTTFDVGLDSIGWSMPWLRELELFGVGLPQAALGPWSALPSLTRLALGFMLGEASGLHELLVYLNETKLPHLAKLELTVIGLDFGWGGLTEHVLASALSKFSNVKIYARAMDPRLAHLLQTHASVTLGVAWLECFA